VVVVHQGQRRELIVIQRVSTRSTDGHLTRAAQFVRGLAISCADLVLWTTEQTRLLHVQYVWRLRISHCNFCLFRSNDILMPVQPPLFQICCTGGGGNFCCRTCSRSRKTVSEKFFTRLPRLGLHVSAFPSLLVCSDYCLFSLHSALLFLLSGF